MAKLLCLWVVLIGIVVSGCSAPSQTIKGAPIQLSMVDQDTVKNSFTSSRRIAVLIGIDKFDDPEWASLVYPEKDALDMATVLNDPRYGNFDKVIALTRPYETTKEYILETINELKRQNTSPNDTVVLYISSHGTIARIQDGKLHQYVVVRDTRINHVTETAIDLEDLKYAFNRLKSRKKALIFAFCHSGQGKSRLDEDMTAELKQIKSTFFVKPIDTTSEATIVLAASAWGETAREDSVLENDIYTHFLIDGIKSMIVTVMAQSQ